MRASFIVVCACVTIGCGARTGDDFFFHPDVDAAIDTPIDVPPPTCPASEPSPGTPCSTNALTCKYPGSKSCGDTIALCTTGAWIISHPGCACPPVVPPAGGFCSLSPPGGTCSYESACGATITATCPVASWIVVTGDCPTPCPATRPGIGAPCPTEGKKCSWTNLCKTVDIGVCTSGAWKLDIRPCGTCPLFTPADRARCTTSAGCEYYLDGHDVCSTQCACDGAHWSCGPC